MASQDNKRIAKNTLFLYLRMIVVLAISLYTTRVVLNVLGVIDYGIYNVVCGFVSMFAFINNSLSNGTQRFYNYNKGQRGADKIPLVYTSSLLIQVFIAIIIVLLLETFGLWYLNNKMIIPEDRMLAAFWIYQFSVLSLAFVVLQVPYTAAVLAFERMDYYAIVSILDVLLKLAIVLALPHIKADQLIFYGLFTLLVSITDFVMYYAYSKKHFSEKLHIIKIREWTTFKDISSFSGWNVFGTFAYMLKDQGLNILLNAFFGPVVNAAKGVAMQVNSALQGFSSNIVAAIRPQLVESYSAGNHSRVTNLMFSMSRLTFIMLFTLSLPVMIELNYMLKIWLSGEIPEYTMIFTELVLINMIISSMNTPLSQVVHATGKMKVYQVGTSIIICSILPISWVFLKMGYSPVPTFIVSIIVSIINQGVCLFLLRRIFPFSIRLYTYKVIVPCVVVSSLSLIIPLLITRFVEASFIRFCINTILTVVITCGLSYLVIMTKDEKNLVLGFLNRIIKRNK